MSRARLDEALASRARHVSPFLMLGDPDPEVSVELAVAAVRAGATMLELGIPYSDPVADGPAIQAAGARALAAGTSTRGAIEVLARIRARVDVPLNLLVYGNLVHALGFDGFVRAIAEAGASSLLVPDVPHEEGAPLRAACRSYDVGHVPLLGPRTTAERARAAIEEQTPFAYLTSIQGVTGSSARHEFGAVADLAQRAPRPLAVGFGLKSRADVEAVHAAGGRIAIVGSALARCIESLVHAEPSALITEFESRVRLLHGSTPSNVPTEQTPC